MTIELMYADFMDAGYRIFGLNKINNTGKCTCGIQDCPASGKHPIASNWQYSPHWDEEQIEVMEMSGQLSTGYGVLVKGLLVVDVDARNGGVESYEALLADIPEIAGAGLIVETGSGGGSKHLYFKAPEGVSLVQHHDKYKGIDFKSSGFVVGPNSLHASGNRYKAVIGTPDDIDDAPAALLALLEKPEYHRAEYNGQHVDVSDEDLAYMLSFIPNGDTHYEEWIRTGMAIHHATGGTGYHVWESWSEKSKKHDISLMEKRWFSFGKSANPVTIGTLIHYAEQAGWVAPVTFVGEVEFDLPAHTEAPDGLPFDISGVDLKRPTGFVGEVTTWINSQCRRPRENLAVAGALYAVGNIIGLRYTDDLDGVTGNMFVFCVAGSRTGKEAIMQSVSKLHKAAGISAAQHGTIKSEQEIIRNLTRHQSAMYVIDEIGIQLAKIQNAVKSGSAPYLDGVIGLLMSAYSKADGVLPLGGDVKEELVKVMAKQLAAIRKRIEENDASSVDERHAEQLEKVLASLDDGLERPFLSLIGFTTPVTFDALVDYQSATNGFIGRALLFNERDTTPRAKKGFRKSAMPPAMKNTLQNLYAFGEYDAMKTRVEYYGDRMEIPTEVTAADMLSDAEDWFQTQAEAHKEKTGLEALHLGAYELVSKVSMVLAAPEGLRMAEHVRWAFALIRRDVEEKMLLVVSNDTTGNTPQMALMARIAGYISADWITVGNIRNKCRGVKPADIDAALEMMVKHNKAETEDYTNARGREVARFRAI